MNKLILIFLTALAFSGCASGVVTIERPIPANMLNKCPQLLPVAADGKAGTILRTSTERTAIYLVCRDNNNALVNYLTGEK